MREKKDINIYIGNEIRIARERAGLTQEQFGEMVSLGTKIFLQLNVESQALPFPP